MDDEADVGLVHPHAEGDGRHHHRILGLEKRFQPVGAHMLVQARMIGLGVDTGLAQGLSDPFSAVAGAGIDHA